MDKKRILAIQHAPENPPGQLGGLLDCFNIECMTLQAKHDELPKDTKDYSALIIFGGHEHVYEENEHPYITREKELVTYAIDHKTPFLGICFGCQVLAVVLGISIYKQEPTRMGMAEIELTHYGQDDAFYHGLPPRHTVFQWHDDRIAPPLPSDVMPLAVSTEGELLAFRASSHSYGIQYHIELTPKMFNFWLEEPSSRDTFIRTNGNKVFQETEQAWRAYYPDYEKHTHQLFENFLRLNGLL
ncbi:glutamine amidotransferase [Ktedonobacter sp. SOSP1-52]|uniref:type 1 glutamine amidotransferase n=1 Tax=Ktedonobacter sp. SOSP1-52 TaxID=2778366 RepID=UPI00191593C8|nr:type 1 glutamine amidotransferase [Ktedonobacter sp. SOSP1-52]GHO70849.1 glutamine amidotransferase [Ktedonobacter sp. SOSP1-52]